jgi:hypothetical protein
MFCQTFPNAPLNPPFNRVGNINRYANHFGPYAKTGDHRTSLPSLGEAEFLSMTRVQKISGGTRRLNPCLYLPTESEWRGGSEEGSTSKQAFTAPRTCPRRAIRSIRWRRLSSCGPGFWGKWGLIKVADVPAHRQRVGPGERRRGCPESKHIAPVESFDAPRFV